MAAPISAAAAGARLALRRAGLAVLDMLLPPACARCHAPVHAQGLLCQHCFAALSFIAAPLCQSCGQPFPHAAAAHRPFCRRCDASPPHWRQARAALVYDDASRRLVLAFKHADRTELAGLLGGLMHRAGQPLFPGAQLLVPVPLHPSRLRQRRYNQALLLAKEVGRRAGLPVCPDALRRLVPTARLGPSGAASRAETLRRAIAARPARAGCIAGRRVLLIDDVLTSGATANACAGALLDAGASNVDVLVACRVPEPRGDEEAAAHRAARIEDDA